MKRFALVHRLSGIALALFLPLHFWALGCSRKERARVLIPGAPPSISSALRCEPLARLPDRVLLDQFPSLHLFHKPCQPAFARPSTGTVPSAESKWR